MKGQESTKQTGDGAESAAAELLEKSGYAILDRNYHCREGEIDIIAEHGETLCFVEVRMRSSAAWGDPSQTVSWAKQHKVVRTALRYLFERRLSRKMIRFDVISVIGRGEKAVLEHIPGAFDAGM